MYSIGANTVVNGAFDTNGRFFPLDSLSQDFIRDANGVLQKIVAHMGTSTFTQTFTYTNGLVSNVSGWVPGVTA
jgi:hypothetical protein